jgi:hypothetical protein
VLAAENFEPQTGQTRISRSIDPDRTLGSLTGFRDCLSTALTVLSAADQRIAEPRILARAISKVVVGIYFLLSHWLFGGGILRRFPRRVSLVKSISVPLRF